MGYGDGLATFFCLGGGGVVVNGRILLRLTTRLFVTRENRRIMKTSSPRPTNWMRSFPVDDSPMGVREENEIVVGRFDWST